ncbi:urea ABC transporter substrate-binding protein [Hydrogenophaga sp.]|jgi:urea transport system substrate-binding protein|uniref:urea ABC transporter substrate-binding protein n=1 Tax=Hydrogenophaga sp. TaxID=1904254 RepID=UPI003F6FEC11
MTATRRDLLIKGSLLSAAAALGPRAWAADPIKLGSLLDTSGNFDAYGKPMDMATDLAIEEINKAGGLLGRQVRKVGYDTQSNMAMYTKFAQQVTRQDKVDVVIGGILSASREAIRPLLNREKVLYVYTPLYEGGVCDGNTFLTGITPAQQAEVLVPFAMKKWGKKAYILAADYNYGQYMAKWFQKFLAENGGSAAGVEFFPLDVADFNSTIAKIQQAKPDFVLSALVGGAHMSFYRQWAAAGMKAKIPMASSTLGVGNEHQVLTATEGDGILVAYNYSTELQNPANKAFLESWGRKYNGNTKAIHELAASHYQGIRLWAEGVKKAGSLSRDKVAAAMASGLAIDAPSGKVTVDPQTHHVTLDVHVMEMRNQQLKVVQSFSQRGPRETQAVCDLRKNPKSSTQHEIKL